MSIIDWFFFLIGASTVIRSCTWMPRHRWEHYMSDDTSMLVKAFILAWELLMFWITAHGVHTLIDVYVP